MYRFVIVTAFILLAFGAFASGISDAADQNNSCVRCHAGLPGSSFVGTKSHSWKGSVHQKRGVTCDKCHGGNPHASGEKDAHRGVLGSNDLQSSIYFKNIPATCGKCHGAEYFKFKGSLHYQLLESKGQGPECVTCHGSMVTTILTPDTMEGVCNRCHNERMGIFPDMPRKAKAVLLLLRESIDLLEADKKIYQAAGGSANEQILRDAQASLQSAKLDWHLFNLDAVTEDLRNMYNSLKKLRPTKRK